MALSGTLTVQTYLTRVYKVSWSATQDISTNKSTISYTIYTEGVGSDWTRLAERTGVCKIAGQTVWNKTERVMRGEEVIKTGTVTVQHDANGNASFSISLTVSVYDAEWLYTGSATYTLDRIYRGVVYIYDGTSFKEHACYIYNGSSWDMYQPYIYTGSGWEMY